jgi:hypothetical protein
MKVPAFVRRAEEIFVTWVIPLSMVVVLAFVIVDIGPAWAARFGHGTHGTFTAQHCQDRRGGCFWSGTFISGDRRDKRTEVGLGGGNNVTHVGQQVPAIDTGDRAIVYPANGGHDWAWTTFGLVFSLAYLVYWATCMPGSVLRRARQFRLRPRPRSRPLRRP